MGGAVLSFVVSGCSPPRFPCMSKAMASLSVFTEVAVVPRLHCMKGAVNLVVPQFPKEKNAVALPLNNGA